MQRSLQQQQYQPNEHELIRDIEQQLSPVVITEVKKEFQEKKKNDSNITYQKESQSLKRSSLVNPSQLTYQNNVQEDEEFLKRLFNIKQEYGLLGNQLQGAGKLKEKYKAPLITAVGQYSNHVKMLYDSYRKRLPVIRLNKDYQAKLDNYHSSLHQINNKISNLDRIGFCGKGKLNREINWAGELLKTHDNVIQAWLNLEPRDIILNSGEVIIEKIVETEPNEEKIRALVAKYIKNYLPQQKVPEPVIIREPGKTVYLPAEPDQLGKAHHLLYALKNYAEAIKLLRELDSKNHPDGQATLGTVYLEGLGVKKNHQKAAECFKKAIKGGSAEAMYKLATMLEKGQHMEAEDRQTNIVKAIEYYKKAALKDDLNALTDLAFLLENGKYVQKDVNEAYTLLKRASDLYFPRALNNLGSMYFKGLITDKGRPNDQKAFELFKLAHDQGYAKAYTNLGICYEKGRAVPKSVVKAVEFYTQAAELGDVDGIFHLGYYTMEEASRANDNERYAEAADMFLEAISKDPDYVEAYYYMGFLYEHGLGVDHDMTTAFRNYKKGAELDHGKSWTKLGTFYSKGIGAPKNPKNTILCYEKAAELGDDEAMNLLGIIYEEGLEVPPDFERAYEFYHAASEMGNSKAKLNLGLMYERGRIEKNIDEAVTLYVDAADHGNVTAQMMLSTRELNTVYRGSMSKIIGREDTTLYDNIEADTVATDYRPASPMDGAFPQFQNAVSQFTRQSDMKPYMVAHLKDRSIPEYYDDEDGTYRTNGRGKGN